MKILCRSFYIQATWNYERMLSLGYCFCMIPFAKKCIKTNEEQAHFLTRNLQFFNTHPYMANRIIGAALKMEEQAIQSKNLTDTQIDRIKKRLSESLAAVGDEMFWAQLKPICAILGILLSLYFGLVGLVGFLVIYNVPHLLVRIRGFSVGYREGSDLIKSSSLKGYKLLLKHLPKFGGFILGLLLIFLLDSDYIKKFSHFVAFGVGMIAMYFMIRRKVPVPLALIALVVVGAILSQFFQ
ncbi:hypothetical protein GWN42_16580 [candidate division KSB1 bacterium]|nr:PTS mannose/fructose/sorbose transporter family subunit IID [candidate division KSB1 bacterium]NIU24888.1 PTS mannose/fructose/sorbose transporter family subunit IID [candidate division KSB1 bacterium]NIU91809.1 hypothetical protein [candidate division KSB1 bacterium]NIV94355.1 hypothetical protein [candidate division KSB1 bacterium]NIW18740.1 hypothetical protein [candidate division KSB1 bacterium]